MNGKLVDYDDEYLTLTDVASDALIIDVTDEIQIIVNAVNGVAFLKNKRKYVLSSQYERVINGKRECLCSNFDYSINMIATKCTKTTTGELILETGKLGHVETEDSRMLPNVNGVTMLHKPGKYKVYEDCKRACVVELGVYGIKWITR